MVYLPLANKIAVFSLRGLVQDWQSLYTVSFYPKLNTSAVYVHPKRGQPLREKSYARYTKTWKINKRMLNFDKKIVSYLSSHQITLYIVYVSGHCLSIKTFMCISESALLYCSIRFKLVGLFLGHRSQRLQWPIVITRCTASVRPSVVRRPLDYLHFRLLLQNRLMDFDETWYGWSTQGPLQVLLFFGQISPGADPGRGKNRSGGVPFFRKLLLQTRRLQQQTRCIAVI